MKNKSIKLILGISLNAIAIVFVIFAVYSVGNNAFAFGAKVFNEQSVDDESMNRVVEVTIADKITTSQLTDILYIKGLINDKRIFYVQVELSDYKNKFIQGTYTLGTSMKPSQMMEILSVSTTASSEK